MPQRTRAPYEPPVYTFHVRILGGGYAPKGCERIWREIELTANQTLANLGEMIPVAFDFADPHLWSFFRNGRAWDTDNEYTRVEFTSGIGNEIPRERDASRIALRDFSLPGITGKREFLYVFDYGDEWHFGVKLAHKRDTLDADAVYPRVVAGEGAAPPQYPDLDDPEPDADPAPSRHFVWPGNERGSAEPDALN